MVPYPKNQTPFPQTQTLALYLLSLGRVFLLRLELLFWVGIIAGTASCFSFAFVGLFGSWDLFGYLGLFGSLGPFAFGLAADPFAFGWAADPFGS